YFTDLLGIFRNTSIKIRNKEDLAVKVVFDGSSVYGFSDISYSDLYLIPIMNKMFKIPWENDLIGCIGGVYRPDMTRHPSDPRYILEKTIDLFKEKGYEVIAGVEIEFFILKNIEYNVSNNKQVLIIDSEESSKGIIIPIKQGYHIAESIDKVSSIRRKIMDSLAEAGFHTVKNHHEVATNGQVEITSESMNPLDLGDFIQIFKLFARKTASLDDHVAVFLPKPFPYDNGSGMHIHISLWRDGKNLFYDPNEENELSRLARYFIGGLLRHGKSLSAIVSPTINSYRRLVPGYEAPVLLTWGIGNRSTAVRVPVINNSPSKIRIEYRPPDPTANPYLALSAILLAGLDGIEKKIEPGEPLRTNAYKLCPEEARRRGIESLPAGLSEALSELENDNDFLKPVWGKEVIEKYIELKRMEIRALQPIPSPAEFLYYNIL
ncbi:MAG: type I glutamate--ammonia ligase, partial [Staphylothermus sp.]|nr:type I glutamate--ammonia ligase [Staphylothermus sp.]